MGVLLMLMTIGGLIVAAILLVVAWLNESSWLRKFVIGGVAVWFVLYISMLVGFSLRSSEHTLAIGESKKYCGFYLDCHLHTAVTKVSRTNALGDRTANGEFYIVTVKVFSDARRATLGLLTVDAHVIDESGTPYTRDIDAESQLGPQPAFEQKVRPMSSFEKKIVFDLPVDVQNPRLDIRDGYTIDHVIEALLVDDEDSIFHKRNYLALSEPPASAGGLTGPITNLAENR